MPKIVIIGGGVAGLTVAHECVERGCEVVVFEKDDIVGGKAATDLYHGMPRDHAAKNISPYYYCLIEQLKRIPIEGGKTVYDELLPRTSFAFFIADKQQIIGSDLSLSARMRRIFQVSKFFSTLVPKKDLLKFGRLIFKYIFSTEKQRKKLDKKTIFEIMQVNESHPLPITIEAIAAVDIHGSALMYFDQFVRQILTIFNPHKLKYMSNYFIKPASDSFLIPWKSHLEQLGVKFILNQEIIRLVHDDNKITQLISDDMQFGDFDACVVTTDIPGLKKLAETSQLQFEFMGADYVEAGRYEHHACGFFIAMSALPANYISGRYYISPDHSWGVAAIFYTINEITDASYFPENCQVYIWLAMDNVKRPGKFTGKTVAEACREEVFEELVQCLHFSEQDREKVIASYWGRTIEEAVIENSSGASMKKHIATVFSRPVNPMPIPNKTQYDNLFLGGEFTDTLQKTATMEKANEAGKRCTKQVLNRFNIEYPNEKFQYKYLPFQASDKLI